VCLSSGHAETVRIDYDSERITLEEKNGTKLAVELEPMKNFFPAEEYHQKYLDKNPDGYCHISDSYFFLERGRQK